MLFDRSISIFESEKERNLYYKVFAGYLLNEFIPGYQDRLMSFCSVINNSKERGKFAPTFTLKLDPIKTHISFDNHIYLFRPKLNRGEFADILIQDESNKTLVAIEAKLHSNWSYKKDIGENKKRLDYIRERISNINIFPILLVSRNSWKNVKKMGPHRDSNYTKFQCDQDCPFIVIFWDQLAEIVNNSEVNQFILSQQDRRNQRYEFDGQWFKQQTSKSL